MAIRDRFTAALDDVSSAIRGISDTFRRPGVPPSVPIPGGNSWASTPKNSNDRLVAALHSPEAYFGAIARDLGPSWTRFSTNPATDLTPVKIVGAQQDAVAGYPFIWSEMIEQALGRDGHLSGIGQQRVDDVTKGSWRLVRSLPDDIAALNRSFSEEGMRGIEQFDDSMGWLLWGNAYSYNATETIWKRDWISFPAPNGKTVAFEGILPRRLDPVHAKHFRFDLRTDEPLITIGGDIVSLPYGKFCFYRGEGQHPITERRGYMWPCIWYSMFRSIGWAGWATFVERFGLPSPLIEYDGDVAQYREQKAAYEDILNSLGQGLGGIVPSQNFKLTFAQPQQGGRASDPHSALSDACDAGQSIRVLGATLTAKIGNVGSFAASSTHADVKYAREEADARRLWGVLRSDLIHPMILVNAPRLAKAFTAAGYPCTADQIIRRVPRGLHRVPREIDPLQRMEICDTAINQLGMKLGMEAIYDEFNLPQPVSDADVAPGAATLISSGGKAVGAIEAATEGADSPNPQQQAAGPKADRAREELGRLIMARGLLREFQERGQTIDPRDALKACGLSTRWLRRL